MLDLAAAQRIGDAEGGGHRLSPALRLQRRPVHPGEQPHMGLQDDLYAPARHQSLGLGPPFREVGKKDRARS